MLSCHAVWIQSWRNTAKQASCYAGWHPAAQCGCNADAILPNRLPVRLDDILSRSVDAMLTQCCQTGFLLGWMTSCRAYGYNADATLPNTLPFRLDGILPRSMDTMLTHYCQTGILYPVIQYCVNVVLIMTLNIIKYFFSRNYYILKTIKKSEISTNRFRSNSLSTTQVTHNCSVKATSSTMFLAFSYNYNRTYNRNESKANPASHLARQGCGCRYPEWQHWYIVERQPCQSWI